MSWYLIAKSGSDLMSIATDFRAQMVQRYGDIGEKCLPVSMALQKYLKSLGYKNATVIQGVFKVDKPDENNFKDWNVADFMDDLQMMEEAKYTPLHYWVELGDILIDITADQFNNELEHPVAPVLVGNKSDFNRHIVVTKDWS